MQIFLINLEIMTFVNHNYIKKLFDRFLYMCLGYVRGHNKSQLYKKLFDGFLHMCLAYLRGHI